MMKINLQNRYSRDLENKLMVAGDKGYLGMGMYTLLYLKWITKTGNSARSYVAVWMGGEFGGEWIHVYVRLSPFAVHLKLSQHS